jgi:hypothetical protein
MRGATFDALQRRVGGRPRQASTLPPDARGAYTRPMVEDGTVPDSEGEPPAGPLDADALPPATLIDRYQIERRLGAGGMGVVYAARDIHLGRVVAVKLVGPRIDTASGQGRLVREAQAMAKLRHPNLAIVHDIGVSGDRLFVVMELVEGGTLADWRRAEPRSWRDIVAVYLQAARGLTAAHAAGFLHRDFKPENVLFGKDGVARVSDFGVAHIVDDEPADGVVGTPGYIAPEILRHEPVDTRADQFSFCVALYVSLFGERPFAESESRPRSPRAGVAPRWLLRIITRGLANDPRDRWPTIAALAAAIERRLGRRRRGIVVAGIAALIVAGTALVIATRETPAPPQSWSPVVIGREHKDAPVRMAVSPDGSTVASLSPSEAWVEPRIGGGTRRRVGFPFPDGVQTCRLSRTGDRLVCSFERGAGTFEIWALDVATGRAERRVPPAAAPALEPTMVFDVERDGSILFGAIDLSRVWRVTATGAVALVKTAPAAGELLTGWVVSPDGTRLAYRVRATSGTRIEVMRLDDRSVQIVSHRICKELEWLTDDSLACAPRTFRNPLVVELTLHAGREATEQVRYSGPEYHQVSALYASSAGVLLSTSPNDQHLALVALDGSATSRPIASGGITDLPPAGWTTSGQLIFGANEQGHLRIMALHDDGAIETVRTGPAGEVPLAVFGETIVFGRFPDGERTVPFFETPIGRKYPDGELFRLARPGAAIQPLGATPSFSALMCAAGRDAPCLLAERVGREAVAIDWDARTGARGRERARWLMTSYAANGALSPDGHTLAQVRRVLARSELSLLDLDTGDRRRIVVPGMSLDFPRWQPDGTLLAMRMRGGERGIVRVRGEAIEMVAAVPRPDEALAIAEDFQINGNGTTAAVLITDSLQTHWWISD